MRRVLAGLAVMGWAASGAVAQEIFDASDLGAILAIAKTHGDAEIVSEKGADPVVEAEMGDIIYVLNFYGCTEGRDCSNIQFRATFRTDGVGVAEMNAWNRDKRFGKAYINENGDPTIEHPVDLGGGVTRENLERSFLWWDFILEEFSEIVGF